MAQNVEIINSEAPDHEGERDRPREMTKLETGVFKRMDRIIITGITNREIFKHHSTSTIKIIISTTQTMVNINQHTEIITITEPINLFALKYRINLLLNTQIMGIRLLNTHIMGIRLVILGLHRI